jgi:hypothetical protein
MAANAVAPLEPHSFQSSGLKWTPINWTWEEPWGPWRDYEWREDRWFRIFHSGSAGPQSTWDWSSVVGWYARKLDEDDGGIDGHIAHDLEEWRQPMVARGACGEDRDSTWWQDDAWQEDAPEQEGACQEYRGWLRPNDETEHRPYSPQKTAEVPEDMAAWRTDQRRAQAQGEHEEECERLVGDQVHEETCGLDNHGRAEHDVEGQRMIAEYKHNKIGWR